MIKTDQKTIDDIQSWLSKTTEEFDDWEFDNDDLIILLNGVVIERYPFDEFKRTVLYKSNNYLSV